MLAALPVLSLASFLWSAGLQEGERVLVMPIRGAPVELESWDFTKNGFLRGKTREGKDWKSLLSRVWVLDFSTAKGLSLSGYASSPKQARKFFFRIRGGPELEGKLVSTKTSLEDSEEVMFSFALTDGGIGTLSRSFLQAFKMAETPTPPPLVKKDDLDEPTKKKKKRDLDGGFAKALANPPESKDLLFFFVNERKIKRVRCDVLRIDGGQLVIGLNGSERQMSLAKVYGVAFGEQSGIEYEPRKTRSLAHVTLLDGRVLTGSILSAASGKGLRLQILDELTVKIAANSIRSIEVVSDRLQYLSQLKPRKVERKNALGRAWPILRDQGEGGRPLCLGDKRYKRGFLVVPGVIFHFAFKRSYDRLLGEIGMPLAGQGSARLRILSGGKPIGPVLLLFPDGKARKLSVDLSGLKELTLELLSTGDLDVGARVVLGDLRVVADSQ